MKKKEGRNEAAASDGFDDDDRLFEAGDGRWGGKNFSLCRKKPKNATPTTWRRTTSKVPPRDASRGLFSASNITTEVKGRRREGGDAGTPPTPNAATPTRLFSNGNPPPALLLLLRRLRRCSSAAAASAVAAQLRRSMFKWTPTLTHTPIYLQNRLSLSLQNERSH